MLTYLATVSRKRRNRGEAAPYSPDMILREVGTSRNRLLVLEALFVAENMATKPAALDHAFEIDKRFVR